MTPPRACLLFLSLCIPCSAEIIQGCVINRTTDQRVTGQSVVLLTTSGEQAHASTDRAGKFQLKSGDKSNPNSPEVVSTVFEGVQYFQAVAAGRENTLLVYNRSSQKGSVSGYLTILQFQVEADKVQVTELHALANVSKPPVTVVDPDNLVLSIPYGAQIQPAIVAGPERGTLTLPLVPIAGERDKYRVDFPLKPGMTKYAITYELPYDNRFVFRREAQYAIKRMGVVMPDSMRFRSLGAKTFQSVRDPSGRREFVLDDLPAKEVVAFELSGRGRLTQALTPSGSRPIASTDVYAEVQSLINARWPGAGALRPLPVSPLTRPGVAADRRWMGVGIICLAAMLVWGLMRRRGLDV